MAEQWPWPWTTPQPQLLEFGSPGIVDKPKSCSVRCREGYFRLTDSQTCRRHSTPLCVPGQYLRAGSPTRDAACVPCSGCPGQRTLVRCSSTADDNCTSCGVLAQPELQRWETRDTPCELACREPWQLNRVTLLCELCSTKCEPGWTYPQRPDNCSHCDECPPKPANSTWLDQKDRYDCTWECEPQHTLLHEACSPSIPVDIPRTYELLQPKCLPGHMLVDFKCTECFEAVKLGRVKQSDLPLQSDFPTSAMWLAGCHWQCKHVLGWTAMRLESSTAWTCVRDTRRNLILEGTNDAWIDSSQHSSLGSQSMSQSTHSLIYYLVVLLVGIPLLMLKLSLLVQCVRQCKRVDAGAPPAAAHT